MLNYLKKRVLSKKGLTALGALLCVLLAACGFGAAADREGAGNAESAEGAYHTEYRDIDNIKGEIVHAEVLEDTIYFILAPDSSAGSPGQRLYRLEDDGSKSVKAVAVELENQEEAWSAAGLGVTPDGSLRVAIINYGESAASGPTGCELRTISADGATKDSRDITAVLSEGLIHGIDGMTVDGQGNTYVMYDKCVSVFDGSGKHAFTIPDLYTSDLICIEEKGAALGLYQREGGMEIKGIDPEDGALGEAYPGIPEISGSLRFVRGSGDSLLYYTKDRLYSYREKEKGEELLSFISQGINGGAIGEILQKENGDLTVLVRGQVSSSDEPSSMLWQAATVTGAGDEELPEKTRIVFGTMVINENVRSQIVNFNKNSSEYEVEIRQYEGPSVDSEQAISNLNRDIMTGNAPDIVDLLGVPSVDMYINKGLLTDLRPWLERDEEISGKQYLENILNVYAKDGKLYGIMADFRVSSVAVKQSVAGDRLSWTLEELMETAESTKGVSRIFPEEYEKSGIFLHCILLSLNNYIDWEKGECRFDSQDFISLLEFCNNNGADKTTAGADIKEAMESTKKALHEGSLLLDGAFLQDVYDYAVSEAFFGENITFIGYPVEGGCGSEIWPGQAYGIVSTAGDKEKEGAWQLLRTFLLEEYQDSCKYSFPVLESALQKKYKEAMTPEYETDINGVQSEKPKKVIRYWSDHNTHDTFELSVYAMTQEQIGKLDALLKSLHRVRGNDGEIRNIVMEEALGYFEGAKSAREAAQVIQSRVQVYVNENR